MTSPKRSTSVHTVTAKYPEYGIAVALELVERVLEKEDISLHAIFTTCDHSPDFIMDPHLHFFFMLDDKEL